MNLGGFGEFGGILNRCTARGVMFGLTLEQARRTVTDNCRAVILHGGRPLLQLHYLKLKVKLMMVSID